jgi:hypothetical protein
MNIGALIDLGVDPKYLEQELNKLNIDGFELELVSDMRRGIGGTKATVIVTNQDNEKHRHLRHVEEIVNGSKLSDKVKADSLKIFSLIAHAEAKVHNIEVQKVHFHEVGALDSIADIVGAAICLDYLKVDKIMAAPIQLGGGTVKCAHGVMPVPAPATALIVEGVPVKAGLVQHEATTPTGAAILVAMVDEFSESFSFPITKTAYGIGQRDVSEVPNILRVFLSDDAESTKVIKQEKAKMLECNIDDMNPEHFEYLMDLLFENGASDAWMTPIIMKKSRPATTLSVLCKCALVDVMKNVIFENSTTLGIREYKIDKHLLDRKEIEVETEYGVVRVKESYFKGERLRFKAEYEDCKKIAKEYEVSIAEVEKAVVRKMGK